MIRLDLNENLIRLPSKEIQSATSKLLSSDLWQYYPAWTGSSHEKDLMYRQLFQAWEIRDNDSFDMLLTGGGDQALDLLFSISKQLHVDTLVFPAPAFSQYYVGAKKYQLNLVELKLDTETFARVADEVCELPNSLLLITLPNNPTGTLLSFSEIHRLVDSINPKILLIDFAYGEFLGRTALQEIEDQFPQALFLRTLSKAFGLAGLRIGTLASRNKALLEKIAKYQIPFPMNGLSMHALGGLDLVSRREQSLYERMHFQQASLNSLSNYSGIKRIVPSLANFNLVEFSSLEAVDTFVAKTKDLFKVRTYVPGLSNSYVRITTGFYQAAEALEKGLQ